MQLKSFRMNRLSDSQVEVNMLTRNCPTCQVEIVYKTKQGLNVANKKSKRCRKCGGAETSKKLKGRVRSDEHKARISESKKGHSWIAILERKYGKDGAAGVIRDHAQISRERSLNSNPMKGKNWKNVVGLKKWWRSECCPSPSRAGIQRGKWNAR